MPMDCQSLGISQFRGTDLELQLLCGGSYKFHSALHSRY